MTLPLLDDSIATAVTALRATIRAALPAPDPNSAEEVPDAVDVFDGPDQERAWSPRSVTVAAAFEDEQSAVDVTRTRSGLGGLAMETIAVACSAYVGDGGSDVVAIEDHRAVMGAIMLAIDRKLQADPTLGGEVARAFISSASWLQGRNANGAGVMVGFVVELVVLS